MTLRYHVHGPDGAPTLVLLGALGSTEAMWEPQLGALTEVFRVIRINARGHGGSPVDPAATGTTIGDLGRDVLATLDELGVRRTHLAGTSLGAMTAMWIAARAPHRVNRLALMCTAAYFGNTFVWADRAARVRAGGMDTVASGAVGAWLTPALAEHDPELVDWCVAMVASADPEGYAQCCDAIVAMDLRPDLPRIAAPTLLMCGRQDPSAGPEQHWVIADAVTDSRLTLIENAAHLASVQAAGQVTRLLLEHFEADRWRVGMSVRREVLGDAHVDAVRVTEFTAAFQDFLTRYAWGEVWARPGLDRATRSAITLAVLTALGAENELAAHVRAALRNGLTAERIGEVLLHTAIYAGLPRANSAYAIARRVLDENAG